MEMPFGVAARSNQGTWIAADYPMHLFVFEYIVRRSILNWCVARLSPRAP
jgi:hypothetical protein